MSVAARLRCESKLVTPAGQTVKFSAVYSQDKASPNYSYSQATPAANLEMYITNPVAYDQFVPGGTYDIQFVEVKE